MVNKILTDDELDELIVQFNVRRTTPTRNLLRAVEQAVRSKISNQKPYLWASSSFKELYVLDKTRYNAAEYIRGILDTPLYLHPTKLHEELK